MRADNHIVKQVDKIKILGFYIQSNLSNHSQIQKLISNLSNRLYNVKKIGSKTKFSSRLILIKSIILRKINYTLPLLINSTQRQLERLNVIINKSCRIIIGNQCLKWSSERMLNKCGFKNIWQMIIESGLNFIHKV